MGALACIKGLKDQRKSGASGYMHYYYIIIEVHDVSILYSIYSLVLSVLLSQYQYSYPAYFLCQAISYIYLYRHVTVIILYGRVMVYSSCLGCMAKECRPAHSTVSVISPVHAHPTTHNILLSNCYYAAYAKQPLHGLYFLFQNVWKSWQ